MNQQQLTGINVSELAQKCKSKKELYNFLAQDCHAFLPKADSTNIYFLKQIIRAEKDVTPSLTLQLLIQYVRRDAVKVSAVPQIDGLTVQDFLDYARGSSRLLQYLPEERDWVHLDRQWICDLLFTLDTDGVSQMIHDAMLQRREKLEQNRDLVIEMRPEFVDALSRCLNFSTERGKAVNLVKDSSKRKRTREQLEEVKDYEDALKQDKQEFLQQTKKLKQQHDNMESELLDLRKMKEQFMQDGNLQNMQNQSPNMRQ